MSELFTYYRTYFFELTIYISNQTECRFQFVFTKSLIHISENTPSILKSSL